jgi:hypothetical protein
MSALARGLVVIGLVLLPAMAAANGLRVRSQQSYYYYYPTTAYYYYPTYSAAVCVEEAAPTFAPRPTQEPAPAPRKLAQPVPAGPSAGPAKTAEPPRSPGVNESRSYFSAYAVAPRDAQPQLAADRARVGFWNLSPVDITLTVANQAYTLPRGKSVKLELPRQFVWRVDAREPQNEKMPESQTALEIVIRR